MGGNTERISIICEAAPTAGVVLGLQAKEGSSLGGREEKLLFLTWRAWDNMGSSAYVYVQPGAAGAAIAKRWAAKV